MKKTCVKCSEDFEVFPEDLDFYDKISPVFAGKKFAILPPTHCPDCRLQRRLAWRNERFLYHGKCGKCGKNIVTVYAPEAKFPIYCHQCWWGDGWSGLNYGQSYDFGRSLFEQLKDLMDRVPQLAIQNDDGVSSENSQYCQDTSYLKNCYLVVGTWYTRDSFYCSVNASYNADICDCINISKSELAYECMDSQYLYNCAFVQNSENCHGCYFGFDLKGCRDCFCCIGLRQKQFHILNKPYSEEEYRKKVAGYDLKSFKNLEKIKKDYARWILNFSRKNMNLQNCENCSGNDLFNSRETYGFSLLNADHARYCHQCDLPTYSHDVFSSGRPTWCYEDMVPDDSYMTHFSWFSWKNKNLLYCINCHSSEHLFGCVSLHRAKYCILNKQYTKEEYEKLVPKIIEKMTKDREWSEFPAAHISFFGYDETIAQEYFPLTREEVVRKGWKWKGEEVKGKPQTYVFQDSIVDVTESVTKEVLLCENCSKNYKIIPQEFNFYKKMRLPISRKCSGCRHKARLRLRQPYKLWKRGCAKCGVEMQTTYAPERAEVVYCAECYEKMVY